MQMQIVCPRCGKQCEIAEKPENGRHILCPFCGNKFLYDDSGETLHNEEVFEVACPHCQTLYEMEFGMEGTTEKCDVCGKLFVVKRQDGGCADVGKIDAVKVNNLKEGDVTDKNSTAQRIKIAPVKSAKRTMSIKPRHRFCQECGRELNLRAVVCPNCGVPVRDAAMGMSSPMDLYNPPSNHLVSSILVTIFCCLPVGIAAIVFTIVANSRLEAGDVKGARSASKTAGMLINVAIICGIVLVGVPMVVWLFVSVILAAAA
ncbi:MAG: CD225/dispanin family protein [Kiritimatiellae bacterium]|nr:CD225/dispanin family protein [Kiritimatiellia bacterium]